MVAEKSGIRRMVNMVSSRLLFLRMVASLAGLGGLNTGISKDFVLILKCGVVSAIVPRPMGLILPRLFTEPVRLKLKKILVRTGLALLFLLMVVAMVVYLSPHLGWRIDAVRSGSMAPAINVGSLVIVRAAAPGDVKVGDVIIFRPTTVGENQICHRVVGIEKGPPLQFRTKGDANSSADPFIIPAANLVGRVSFHVPLLGYVVMFLKTMPGLLVALVIPGLIIIGACMKSFWHELVKKIRETP